MGQHRVGQPEALVIALQQKLRLAEFVETGTHLGGTVAWAAGHFAQVTSIELSPAFHASAKARFEGQSRISLLNGDSSAMLRQVVSALAQPAVFWLDAHWSGSDTAGREMECPILAEIAAINESSLGHVILVDDARLFCEPPPPPQRVELWPNLLAVIRALDAGARRYVILHEDVFVAVPIHAREFLVDWLQDQRTTKTSDEGGRGRLWKKIFQ